MLDRNCLQPPRPSSPSQTVGWQELGGSGSPFASALDYDATGILPGVDPFESSYWWMPEMFVDPVVTQAFSGIEDRPIRTAGHAARTSGSTRGTAAA